MSLYRRFCDMFQSQNKGGFEIPFFLLNRKIGNLDHPSLQKLFKQNDISFFHELSSDMIRNFLKQSYSEAVSAIKILGLYGVVFISEKLQKYSFPPSKDYRLLKFKKTTDEVILNYTSQYDSDYKLLKRFLWDEGINTSFLLNGIKLDVLLSSIPIQENAIQSILSPEFYMEKDIVSLYESTQDNAKEDAIIPANDLQEFTFNQNQGLSPKGTIDYLFNDNKMSVRLYNALKNEKVLNIMELSNRTIDQLMRIPNLGYKSINELHSLIAEIESLNEDSIENDVINEQWSNIQIEDLELSVRASRALMNKGVMTLEDLMKFNKIDLYRIKNMGRKSVQEVLAIREKYERFGPCESISENLTVQKIPSYIADIDLLQQSISVRLYNVLKSANLCTVKDILPKTPRELLCLESMGRLTLKELTDILDYKGIIWGRPYEIVDAEMPAEEKLSLEKLNKDIQVFEEKEHTDIRKRNVFKGRISSIKKQTLQSIACEFNISRERVRQIENSQLKQIGTIISRYLELFQDLFIKYGDIISYQTIPEFKEFQNLIPILKNANKFLENISFDVDIDLGLLIQRTVDLDDLSIEIQDDIYISIEQIEKQIAEKLSSYIKIDEGSDDLLNYQAVCKIILADKLENEVAFNKEKSLYCPKEASKDSEILALAFKELYPEGILLRQKIDDIFETIKRIHPSIDCSSARALEARLSTHNNKIILTGSGFYQHIDTIIVSEEAPLFALAECKKKLEFDGHPFLISVIFEKYRDYFENNGVFSEYLLFSLLKRLRDPDLLFRKLTVSSASMDRLSKMEQFENFFRNKEGVVPENTVNEHFIQSLGWSDFGLINYLNQSKTIFKISSGYFHKDNITCNNEKLIAILEKVENKVKELGYVQLDVIRKNNFADWIQVFGNEDLDARSMASIIKATFPNFRYEINPTGLISDGMVLRSYEVLEKWITKTCIEKGWVTNAEITDFCEENAFHRYNTKQQIKDKLAEYLDECVISYEYAGITEDMEQSILTNVKAIFEHISEPYISIPDLMSKMEFPSLKNKCQWTECLFRAILQKHNLFTIYHLIVMNPSQTKISRKDMLVAHEIANFSKTWYMETSKLEKLLRRNNILKKNETLFHKSVQNDIFFEDSYIEMKDNDKNVCIKAAHRKDFNATI